MRFEALNKLWESVRESSHDFRASTEVFPILDVDKTTASLDLREKGAENGRQNRPATEAQSFDEVEQRIIARIEEEKQASYQTLEDQFQTFESRLRNLDFEGQFGLIRQANVSSLSDFKAEAASGVDELHGLRRALRDAEEEMTDFRARHKLRGAAKVSSKAMTAFKVSLIVFLVLFEMIMNGSFLAKGSEQGIVGGVTEAAAFALINIGAALLLAIFCVRYLLHRSFFLKLIGLLSLLVYIALAIGINLVLAHYREVSATLFEGAGAEVVQRLKTAPLGLAELNSWMLFAVGIMFSLIAFIDGIYLSDPYPGYAGVQKRLDVARNRYIDRRQDLIEDLRDVRDDHNEKIEAIVRDLSMRRQESSAIIAHRTRTVGLFIEHQNHLERAGNALLTIYRDANRAARTSEPPSHFASVYRMDRLKPILRTGEEWDDSRLAAKVEAAQLELNEQIWKIGVEFEDAMDKYHKLDSLFPESAIGTAQAT